MANDDRPKDRATLADVLGALVTSVSRARVQADLSSIEIAGLYHKHELLRAMPVPRLRLNRIEVSVPLVVTEIQPAERYVLADPKDAERGLIADLRRALKTIKYLLKELSDALENDQLIDPKSHAHQRLKELSACLEDLHLAFMNSVDRKNTKFYFENRFAPALERALAVFREDREEAEPSKALDIQNAAGKAILQVLTFRIAVHRNSLLDRKKSEKSESKKKSDQLEFDPAECYPQLLGEKDPVKLEAGEHQKYAEEWYKRLRAAIPDLLEEMKARAGIRAFSKPPRAPELEIAALTSDVQNLGTPGTITRLNMVMSEEGLEWVAESSGDGGRQWKLLQE